MDRGEGQQWSRAPGNLYSTPQKITIQSRDDRTIKIALTRLFRQSAAEDTKYIKHVKIESKLLTKFGGRPCNLVQTCCCPTVLTVIQMPVIRW